MIAMRPSLLNRLFAPVTALPGIAERTAKLYGKLTGRDDGARVVDLLFHLPTGVIDRRQQPKLRDVAPDTVVTVDVHIDGHRPAPPNRPRAPYLVYASDDTGTLTITYFSPRREHIERMLPVGSRRYVSGTVKFYDGMLQMVHPDRVADPATFASMTLVDPVYPLTEGLTQNMVRRSVATALDQFPPALPEWLDAAHLSRAGWADFKAALTTLHRPPEPADATPESKAWSRLAYDELLASQLALALVRRHLRRPGGWRGDGPTTGACSPSPPKGGEGRGEGAYPRAMRSWKHSTPCARAKKSAPEGARGSGGFNEKKISGWCSGRCRSPASAWSA
jgi:ATP-dependent DNA helicase RecG